MDRCSYQPCDSRAPHVHRGRPCCCEHFAAQVEADRHTKRHGEKVRRIRSQRRKHVDADAVRRANALREALRRLPKGGR